MDETGLTGRVEAAGVRLHTACKESNVKTWTQVVKLIIYSVYYAAPLTIMKLTEYEKMLKSGEKNTFLMRFAWMEISWNITD